MAQWLSKEKKRSCETCEMFRSPTSFPKGAKVHIAEAFDCVNCEVTLSQPSQDNENILDLYDSLPQKFDSMSGVKDMSADGIRFVFTLYDIHSDLWEDYYNRLMFFHREFLNARERRDKKKKRMQEHLDKAKQGRSNEASPGKAGIRV